MSEVNAPEIVVAREEKEREVKEHPDAVAREVKEREVKERPDAAHVRQEAKEPDPQLLLNAYIANLHRNSVQGHREYKDECEEHAGNAILELNAHAQLLNRTPISEEQLYKELQELVSLLHKIKTCDYTCRPLKKEGCVTTSDVVLDCLKIMHAHYFDDMKWYVSEVHDILCRRINGLISLVIVELSRYDTIMLPYDYDISEDAIDRLSKRVDHILMTCIGDKSAEHISGCWDKLTAVIEIVSRGWSVDLYKPGEDASTLEIAIYTATTLFGNPDGKRTLLSYMNLVRDLVRIQLSHSNGLPAKSPPEYQKGYITPEQKTPSNEFHLAAFAPLTYAMETRRHDDIEIASALYTWLLDVVLTKGEPLLAGCTYTGVVESAPQLEEFVISAHDDQFRQLPNHSARQLSSY